MNLRAQLAEVELQAEALRRRIAAVDCVEAGCDMRHVGGRNAGCELGNDCCCSVPVYSCPRCGDSDYGDNPEADEIRRTCAQGDPACPAPQGS